MLYKLQFRFTNNHITIVNRKKTAGNCLVMFISGTEIRFMQITFQTYYNILVGPKYIMLLFSLVFGSWLESKLLVNIEINIIVLA